MPAGRGRRLEPLPGAQADHRHADPAAAQAPVLHTRHPPKYHRGQPRREWLARANRASHSHGIRYRRRSDIIAPIPAAAQPRMATNIPMCGEKVT